MNKKGEINWLAVVISGVLTFAIVIGVFALGQSIEKQRLEKQINLCDDLRSRGYIVNVEHYDGDPDAYKYCYIYLKDGRKMIYDDIKQAMLAEPARI